MSFSTHLGVIQKSFFVCIGILSFTSFAVAGDIKDVRPPVSLPLNIFWIMLIVVLVLSLFMGLFWLWNRHRARTKKMSTEEEVVKEPWEIAVEELERLKAEDLLVKGKYKEYYSRLSNIVRAYFERRFRIRAPEMTTEEFLVSLKDCNFLKQHQKDTLQEFLHSSDMVKFAKYNPSISEAESSFVLANRLIKETIPNHSTASDKEERDGI